MDSLVLMLPHVLLPLYPVLVLGIFQWCKHKAYYDSSLQVHIFFNLVISRWMPIVSASTEQSEN